MWTISAIWLMISIINMYDIYYMWVDLPAKSKHEGKEFKDAIFWHTRDFFSTRKEINNEVGLTFRGML